jgi:hypothetical protein
MLLVLPFTSCSQWPQIAGAYADRLTYRDVVDIRALVKHRRELRPIFRIWMHWPDSALVDTGNVVNTGDTITTFIARKKNGQWTIDESSIERHEAIITSDARSRQKDLTNRWSQPLAVVMRTFDLMKQFSEFAWLPAASGGSASSR